MVNVSSWGRLGSWAHQVCPLSDRSRVARQLQQGAPGIAYGMGRSYGDVCLNPDGVLWHTTGLDRFISWDQHSGRLVCEAGVLLRDIQRLMVPRGWMLPVTPGTQLVTVGGAIANDVHGKNHHAYGCFCDQVIAFELARSDGNVLECSRAQQPGWFAATAGGLGLTGVITKAELQLRPVAGPWLHTETTPYAGLEEFFALADQAATDWEHTVAWIDCLSGRRPRGIFMRARHCGAEVQTGPGPARHTRKVPFVPPLSLVNGLSLRALNSAYYAQHRARNGAALAHYERFFYPLDRVLEWNRIYGPAGFFQYQSVVPRCAGHAATQAMLDEITRCSAGSFLAVLKTFGERPASGMLSFVQPGVTLALDFPNQGARTSALFERLDAVVREAGGRLYLAKDARMPRAMFEAGYPRLAEFLPYRDPGLSSAMSRRLIGT